MAKSKRNTMGKIFHNKTVVDGITFDSQTEAEYYQYLKKNIKVLNIKEFELQPKFILQEKCILANSKIYVYDEANEKDFKKMQRKYPGATQQAIYYIADFKITYDDDTVEIIDVKGLKTADFKIKEKMFNYKYPEFNGLKCICKHKSEWLTWEETQKRKKEDKKNKKEIKKEVKKEKEKKEKKKKKEIIISNFQ